MPFYTAAAADAYAAPVVWDRWLLAEPSQLALARSHVAETARKFAFECARAGELTAAVNEAVTNAIRHGKPDRCGRIRIRALATRERLTFAVCDYGIFVEPRGKPGPLSEYGRGFQMMSRLVDEVLVRAGANGTVVMLSKERM